MSSIVFTMKMLALSLLLCAVMVLTRATDTDSEVAGAVMADAAMADAAMADAAVADAAVADSVMSNLIKRTSTCPHGWKTIGSRCFCFVSTEMSWGKAEKNCQTMGGNLASVHNADEYHRIQAMIQKATRGFPRTWLGGSDCQEEGQWLWSDGTSFNYKHCGYFNNYFWREHCLQMNYGGNKCWDDLHCGKILPSVCVKKCQKAGL